LLLLIYKTLDLGADIVMHSALKYLGPSDVIQGCLIMNDATTVKNYISFKKLWCCSRTMDCFLVLRGIKTLAVRMGRIIAMGQKLHIG
jgi:cystathionine beta-lyase/cystathionine gamma-synthase